MEPNHSEAERINKYTKMFLFLPHRREKIHEVLFVNILKLFRAVL
jgi:hypothetical protein